MPKSCRAPHCSNAAGQPRGSERRLSFYKFPLQDSARLQRWLAQMQQEHWVPTRHQHLCSDHFEPHCFEYRWGVRYLRPDAVPTIFPRPENSTEAPKAAPKAPPHPRVTPPAPPPAAPNGVNNGPQLLQPRDGFPPPAPSLRPGAELSSAQLVALLLTLQRKLKVLQQRNRRHRTRLRALEGLLERLRNRGEEDGRVEELCLQPLAVPPQPSGAVTIVCSVPPPEGTAGDIGATIGDTGDIEATRDIGAVGDTGAVGDIGDIGDIEATRDIGDVGDIGDIEATRDIGATGAVGDIGDIEATRDIGDVGDVGDIGDIGAMGTQQP